MVHLDRTKVILKRAMPFLDWFGNYNGSCLKIDMISGITVALVLIPQSMAYAQLAGLPAYYGLYASFLPPLIAAVFGSSRQLATGPVAVVSLMTAASLEPLATTGSEGYIAYAILLAFMVGAFQFALGVLRLGLVVNFLSHPVVNGFTNAAALIIASSQLSKMFGVYVDKAEYHFETIYNVLKSAVQFTHWPTLFMGLLAFGIMYSLKRISKNIPNVLVAVAVTTVISWAMGFEYNRHINIASIRSEEAVELIRGFNNSVEAIPRLVEKRADVNRKIEELNNNGDSIARLNARHDYDLITTQIDGEKKMVAHFRGKIRSLLLKGVEKDGDDLLLYTEEGIPEGMESDGRTWRIKVGNKPLDGESLLVTGGGAVVGEIPPGLPSLSLPDFEFSILLKLLPFAAIISLLGFMEAISIAKAMAAKTGQRLDPNQELIGQGLANMTGSFAQSYPTSGSFSRSAVNIQAGAVSGLSSVFTSMAVIVVLLFCTPLLYHLPQAVLAAVIMMAVIGLVNVSGFIHAYKVKRYDGIISIVSFLFTLGFAPHLDKGIIIGVVLSLLVFLYKSMRPTVSSLSRHSDMELRNTVLYKLKGCEYMELIRFEGTLFFANASYLEDQINDRILHRDKLNHIIIAANGINDIDATGEESLSLIIENTRNSGIDISFSGINENVMSVLKRTHMFEKIGEDHIFPTMEKAIAHVHPIAHANSTEEACPLKTVCRLT